MATIPTLPSLSEDGWIKNPQSVADYLFAHFFLSDRSQTQIFEEQVSSFQWILATTQGNMADTLSLTRSTLTTYFSKYFNNVVVEVQEEPNEKEPSKAQISIYINFTDSTGKVHNFGRLLPVSETKTAEVLSILNA